MKNIVVGNSLGTYVIATCLDYLNKDFIIYDKNKGINKGNSITPILFLKYNDEQELKFYFDIFKINYNNENISKYTKKIKVGYFFNGKIYEIITQEMYNNYLSKQNRIKTKSSMSDNLNSYYGILLNVVFEDLKLRYEDKIVDTMPNVINSKVYDNTKEFINNEGSVEYVVKTNNDVLDFDYVYDCNLTSNVKRYSKNYTECISEPHIEHIKILNYYDKPKIYTEFDVKDNVEYIYIGRYATKTQIKQEDIIKYVLKREGYEWNLI